MKYCTSTKVSTTSRRKDRGCWQLPSRSWNGRYISWNKVTLISTHCVAIWRRRVDASTFGEWHCRALLATNIVCNICRYLKDTEFKCDQHHFRPIIQIKLTVRYRRPRSSGDLWPLLTVSRWRALHVIPAAHAGSSGGAIMNMNRCIGPTFGSRHHRWGMLESVLNGRSTEQIPFTYCRISGSRSDTVALSWKNFYPRKHRGGPEFEIHTRRPTGTFTTIDGDNDEYPLI
jgi:hypothetical protein